MSRKKCYICHRITTEWSKNPCLCPECYVMNQGKREQTADLTGYVALVTGGRFNIGFQVGLKLLRSGAKVYVTSRFPADTIDRYSKEPDWESWKDRLFVLQADFRYIPGVLGMIEYLKGELPEGLDIIINNAAQTIRRPYEYYRGLVDTETVKYRELPCELHNIVRYKSPGYDFRIAQVSLDRGANELGRPEDFPLGQTDMNGWQLDLRPKNTWNLGAAEISVVEFLEVQTVNSTTPFLLCSGLKELLEKSQREKKYIINVAASAEGSFSYPRNNSKHPHLNMAKASLNMLTKTLSKEYKRSGIYVNSVDTGWVNYEGTWKSQQRFFSDSRVPLDPVDGASRILDPIFSGSTESGKLFKDYTESGW